jgi:hypothetical protein
MPNVVYRKQSMIKCYFLVEIRLRYLLLNKPAGQTEFQGGLLDGKHSTAHELHSWCAKSITDFEEVFHLRSRIVT